MIKSTPTFFCGQVHQPPEGSLLAVSPGLTFEGRLSRSYPGGGGRLAAIVLPPGTVPQEDTNFENHKIGFHKNRIMVFYGQI